MKSKYKIKYDDTRFMYYILSPHISMGPYSNKEEADGVLRAVQKEEEDYAESDGNYLPTIDDFGVSLKVEDYVPDETVKSDGGSSAYYSFEMMAYSEG